MHSLLHNLGLRLTNTHLHTVIGIRIQKSTIMLVKLFQSLYVRNIQIFFYDTQENRGRKKA